MSYYSARGSLRTVIMHEGHAIRCTGDTPIVCGAAITYCSVLMLIMCLCLFHTTLPFNDATLDSGIIRARFRYNPALRAVQSRHVQGSCGNNYTSLTGRRGTHTDTPCQGCSLLSPG